MIEIMEDPEGSLPSSKKRHAGREISRDDPGLDEDDQPEPEMGTFKRASDEVLATRRIVKIRRNTSQAPAPSSANPFAGIQLVAQTNSTSTPGASAPTQDTADKQGNGSQEGENAPEGNAVENGVPDEDQGGNSEQLKGKPDDSALDNEATNQQSKEPVLEIPNTEKEDQNIKDSAAGDVVQTGERDGEEKEETGDASKETEKHADEEVKTGEKEEANQLDDQKEKPESTSQFSSFQQLFGRQNAFTGLAGTGFSASSFSFGLLSKEGSAFGTGSGPLFGQNSENTSLAVFGSGAGPRQNNENTSLSGASTILFGSGTDGDQVGNKPTMQEVPVETGEENEKLIFKADAILFEYLDGGWKERGKGEVKLNVATSGPEKARLVMRAKGNYRLILNASLYPDMALKSMEKKGVTFACVNSASEAKDGLTTVALKFKEASILEEFRGVVETHKAKKDTALKTPENSPKASDD